MIYLLYLLIILAHICTAYGMNTENNRRKQREDDSYASDYNPYLHKETCSSSCSTLDQYTNDSETNSLPHDSATQSQPIRRNSIGDYTEYLLHCLRVERWWSQHPYKKYRKSDFHKYSEKERRKSLPPSFFLPAKNQE